MKSIIQKIKSLFYQEPKRGFGKIHGYISDYKTYIIMDDAGNKYYYKNHDTENDKTDFVFSLLLANGVEVDFLFKDNKAFSLSYNKDKYKIMHGYLDFANIGDTEDKDIMSIGNINVRVEGEDELEFINFNFGQLVSSSENPFRAEPNRKVEILYDLENKEAVSINIMRY